MKKVVIYLVLTFALFGCFGDPVESSFKESVTKYFNALQDKNWEKAVSYLFQAKIIALGGMEGAVQTMKTAMAPLTIKSWSLGKVQVVHDHDDIYLGVANITLESERKNQINGKTYQLKIETGVIGHTDNKGKTWHFIGVTQAERNILGTIAPDIFQTLDIPKENLFIKENGKWEPFKM